MYNFIVNPETGRKVNINGRLGRKILKKYLMISEIVRNSNKLFNRYQMGGQNKISYNSKMPTCNHECLNKIFGNFKAVIKTEVDLRDINDNQNVNATYGTITPVGIEKLINNLNITNNDTFLDLGSGIGNVVVQFALNSNVKKARGIEYVKSRYNQSLNYINEFKKEFKNEFNNTNVNIENKDINNVNINDSSIIFTCSTCFPNSLMETIKRKCENNPNLKYFITQKKLDGETTLKYVGNLYVECSWNKNCIHHIYTNTNASLKNV